MKNNPTVFISPSIVLNRHGDWGETNIQSIKSYYLKRNQPKIFYDLEICK